MDNSFEEITLESNDGAKLNGLHFKIKNPKGAILYFHGNAGDLQRWGQLTEFFVDKKYSVIVMDYRGYGKSTGKKSQQNLYDDTQLWYDYATKYYKESEITVYGRSLGTAFATYVSLKNKPKKLLLESPFYSIEEVAKYRFPFLPVRSLLHYKFPTYQYINEVSCPITIYHGINDKVINYQQGKKLFESIENSSKKLISIPEGGHNDLVNFKEYTSTIEEEL
ncbi:MAG: alpha/beta hydrolase [Flavobacteriaceae bacterium]|nr:alpha/beta hydrolase [Flavobacteriaceae bacterium]